MTIALVQTSQETRAQIDALATANSDSTQWSLAQSEVELLALIAAITSARQDAQANLSQVRMRFDVFYSRARTLGSSPLLHSLREETDVVASLARIVAFLERSVPYIDGDDTVLRAGLGDLQAGAQALRSDIRTINLRGVSVLSRQADAQRFDVSETLSHVSRLTLALFGVLLFALFLLIVLFRRAQDRAVEESQTRSRLEAMVSTSLDAVIAVNIDGRIVDFNGAAERIFGYSAAEAVGQKMEDLIIPDHFKPAHQAGMARYRKTRQKKVIGKGLVQLEAMRKSGEVFPVELSIATAQSDQGEIFVSFLRDVSRRIEAENELIKARDDAVAGEKAKADLIAVMSHEMRTPLNGMLGTLDLLDHGKHTPKDREYLEIIRASGKLLLHHVDNVLEISRAEAGKLGLSEVTFSVPALLRELAESQRSVAEHRGNTLSHAVALNGQDYALGDPTRLRQVLLNLIGNAIKFTRNGAITIEATRERHANMIEFRVTDTGIGIPPEDRARIFQDFVTLDASFKRAVGGTGLGLAIVRRLVEAMDGEVGLESSAGYGSSFWVRLPLQASDAKHLPEAAAPDDAGADAAQPVPPPMKVLVVEDNKINRIVVRDLLEQDGHEVDEAHDGSEGRDKALSARYDIVFMDISMPVMDGIEATRAIRAAEPPGTHLPIIALTANAATSEKDRFLAAGIDDILIKPISRNGVRWILNRVGHGLPEATETSHTHVAFDAMVDHSHLKELSTALGPAKVSTLITSFVTEMEAGLIDITEGIARYPETEGLREKVHHAAGSSALLGAEALRTALVTLENHLDGAEQEVALPVTPDGLVDIWEKTAPELELYLK